AVLGGVGVLFLQLGDQIQAPEYVRLGGLVLAGGTLAGAIFQWVAQLIAQWQAGMGTLRLRWDWRIPGVKDVMKVMAPATLSSGMLHINVYTDLYFASTISGAAAAMRYANFIVLTPLGVISNMLLVPFLPVFARLAAPENWDDLKIRIRQGLLLTALSMLPLTAIFVSLSGPIVRLVYERYAFDEEAAALVAPVLMAYGLGMFFYLGRDVLVRVFYALGDGETPFRISIANIFLNGILDFLLVRALATPGLVLATVGVNITSMALLLGLLHRRLNGLPLGQWGRSLLGILFASAIAGGVSWGTSQAWEYWAGTSNLLLQALQVGLASVFALAVFAAIASRLNLPEFNLLGDRLLRKFRLR
ncbi:MAG: murein biosynthesis integral membrane protein MurJ, partial [Jaaginema sp. PMC 1079.18]|nr:murein biosynthesis integral membrane protein MurJ [Jaaginema sp. PMC 1079.18]